MSNPMMVKATMMVVSDDNDVMTMQTTKISICMMTMMKTSLEDDVDYGADGDECDDGDDDN
eukprot:5379951-Pyramimonas_sp.AAC.1